MKTIRQIADDLGIDKQRVYRYIKRNRISEAHQCASGEVVTMYYDDATISQIQSHFSSDSASGDASREVHHEAHQCASSDAIVDAVISLLRKELEIKNEQIRELNLRLAESNTALIAAQQSAQAAQALHAGTMQQQMISETTADGAGDGTKEKRSGFFGWFARGK